MTHQTPPKKIVGLYLNVHPVDLVERAKSKLRLFNVLMSDDGGLSLNLRDQKLSDGLFFFIQSITDELDLAVDMMLSDTSDQTKN